MSDSKISKNKKGTSTIPRLPIPLVEKYRPRTLKDLILDPEISMKLQEIVKGKSMPNMIITGNPSAGKTTSILCIARDLLGDKWEEGVMELNASDDRNLPIINEKIIPFCKKKFYPDVNKIIILDEADNIKKKTQNIISSLLDQYPNTRFVFTCNNFNEIIEPIHSRCLILKYNSMSNDNIKKRLKYICKKEDIKYTPDGIDSIVYIADNDIRQAINALETVSIGYEEVNRKNVFKICDTPNPILIKHIIELCIEGKNREVIKEIKALKDKGYSCNDIVLSITKIIENDKSFDEETRITFMDYAYQTYINLNKGIDDILQVYSCVSRMCMSKK